MQRIILLLLTLIIFYLSANGQNKNSVSGRVTDSISRHGIEYATITLYDAKTDKVLNGSTTDSLGDFKLTGIDSGLYDLSFESIGYVKKSLHNIHFKGNH